MSRSMSAREMVEDDNLVDISLFQQDPYVQECLQQGLSLGEIAIRVDTSLQQEEQSIVYDYLKECGNTLLLSGLMDDMDNLLQGMTTTLGGYKEDISRMNKDIALIQVDSVALDTKLSNRRKTLQLSSDLLEGITISHDLIKKICDAEINEFYIANLKELDTKLQYVLRNQEKDTKAFTDVVPELERLRLKAVDKIRAFLLQKISSFRSPNTNIPLIQQNVLLKYKDLFWFLVDRFEAVGMEIHGTYIGAVSTYYLQAFERYHKALSLLQSATVDKTDMIGLDESVKRSGGLFGVGKGAGLKDSSNIFGLADRLEVLTTRDSGIIVPDHAREGGKKFPYEALFKSLTRLLLDNACSEYIFTTDFFSDPKSPSPLDSLTSFFLQAFEPTLKFVEGTIRAYVDSSYDAIGLLFCIRVNTQNIRIMQRRRLPHLDNFLNLINILLWPKFQQVLGLHIDSLKKGDPRKLIVSKDPGVHYIARRYAELSASILTLNQGYDDAMVLNTLSRLRSEFESLMYKLAAEFPDKKKSLAFWINNLDLIESTLNEHQDSDTFDGERAFFSGLIEGKVQEFVVFQLTPHIGSMIETLPKLEKVVGSGVAAGGGTASQKETLERIAIEFNTNWRASIEKINEDLSSTFPNFKNGARVLHSTLTGLVLWYKRFLTVWDVICKGMKTKVVPVGMQTVLVEIKKWKQNW